MLKMLLHRVGILLVVATAVAVRADEVVMQNGDKLTGTIQIVSPTVVVLQNENLGTVSFPRTKVATVTFGPGTTKPAAPAMQTPTASPAAVPASAQTNSPAATGMDLRGIRDQTNLVQQVESQFLGSAGPDALAKFNNMLDGLSTGKIDMNELRTQAKAAADQLRSLKKDAGPDADTEVDTYLTILDNFLKETAPTNPPVVPIAANPATNSPAATNSATP